MPTDTGARPVFCQQYLLQVVRFEIGKDRSALAQRPQERRHVFRLLQPTTVKVVAPAERYDAPLPEKPMKLKLTKCKFGKALDARRFLRFRNQLWFVPKAGRQAFLFAKQVRL